MSPRIPNNKPLVLESEFSGRADAVRRLRAGLFVCWSFSTFSNEEWTKGVQDLSFFNPTGFDPDDWAATAAGAGMTYLLLLAKHHDGFCLWDSSTTNWKVTLSPIGVDVLEEVRKACDRQGLKLALYFSEGDWTWPDGGDGARKRRQIEELLTHYGPIEFFWMDHAAKDGGLSHEDTFHLVKKIQPDCYVGFNHGEPAGEIRLGEMGRPVPLDRLEGAGKYMNPESLSHPYLVSECAFPLLGKERWFYTKPEWDQEVLPVDTLLEIHAEAERFNSLVNISVGPDRAGRLRAVDRQVLLELGARQKVPPLDVPYEMTNQHFLKAPRA